MIEAFCFFFLRNMLFLEFLDKTFYVLLKREKQFAVFPFCKPFSYGTAQRRAFARSTSWNGMGICSIFCNYFYTKLTRVIFHLSILFVEHQINIKYNLSLLETTLRILLKVHKKVLLTPSHKEKLPVVKFQVFLPVLFDYSHCPHVVPVFY